MADEFLGECVAERDVAYLDESAILVACNIVLAVAATDVVDRLLVF